MGSPPLFANGEIGNGGCWFARRPCRADGCETGDSFEDFTLRIDCNGRPCGGKDADRERCSDCVVAGEAFKVVPLAPLYVSINLTRATPAKQNATPTDANEP